MKIIKETKVDEEPPSSDKGSGLKYRVADRDISFVCSLLIRSGKVGIWARRVGSMCADKQYIK